MPPASLAPSTGAPPSLPLSVRLGPQRIRGARSPGAALSGVRRRDGRASGARQPTRARQVRTWTSTGSTPIASTVLVRAGGEDGEPGPVIGTYRVLTPCGGQARRRPVQRHRVRPDTPARAMRSRMAEIGRSCVHADHRSGGAILALWAALAEFMARNGLDTVIGCASVSMRDGGHFAASLWKQIAATAPGTHRLPGSPAPAAADRATAPGPARRSAGPDPGLPALRRQADGRAGMGPGLQHRRPAAAAAHCGPAGAVSPLG